MRRSERFGAADAARAVGTFTASHQRPAGTRHTSVPVGGVHVIAHPPPAGDGTAGATAPSAADDAPADGCDGAAPTAEPADPATG